MVCPFCGNEDIEYPVYIVSTIYVYYCYKCNGIFTKTVISKVGDR